MLKSRFLVGRDLVAARPAAGDFQATGGFLAGRKNTGACPGIRVRPGIAQHHGRKTAGQHYVPGASERGKPVPSQEAG